MLGLFSPPPDFAPTQPDSLELPAWVVRIGRCPCCQARLFRIRRSLWMRVLPRLRLYQCACCGCRVLRWPLPGTSIYSMRAYLPRYERR